MTATDELRRLLDERGTKWQAPASFDGTAQYDTTAGGYWFHEFNGKITIHGLTPAQAIAATLGESMTDTEKAALERRIDELCQENERLRQIADGAANEADRLTHDAAALQIENDKLRELCRRYCEYVSQDRCEGCVYKTRCNNGLIDECWQRSEIRNLAHELGIEVPA